MVGLCIQKLPQIVAYMSPEELRHREEARVRLQKSEVAAAAPAKAAKKVGARC